jgi:3-oxoacyl-[acyl-carrier-protein] synthase-3
MLNSIITGSGSFIPEKRVNNSEFNNNQFYSENGERIEKDNVEVIQKFQEITGIKSRRYVETEMSCSQIATIAGQKAIESAHIDKESIDYIIVAHNFGDVLDGSNQSDMVPSIASRVKHELGIENEFCIAYDIIFGCPGWVQGLIQAHIFIQSGEAKRCLIIGTEVLSRVIDPSDRDTMIFADGAGAVIIEGIEEENKRGVLTHAALSHTGVEKSYLQAGYSYDRTKNEGVHFMKMNGHKIYLYAIEQVPKAMKYCMDKINLDIDSLDKILLHQANHKMDEAIVKRLFRAFGKSDFHESIMPMTIEKLGNSSVATVPTLYDLIIRNQLKGHTLSKGNKILLASVGAGMNINCVVYEC